MCLGDGGGSLQRIADPCVTCLNGVVVNAGGSDGHAARSTADTARIEEALAYQAVAAARMGQMDVALEATREELRLDSLSGDRPNLSRAYNTHAGLCLQAGRTEDASLYIRKAIESERMKK